MFVQMLQYSKKNMLILIHDAAHTGKYKNAMKLSMIKIDICMNTRD